LRRRKRLQYLQKNVNKRVYFLSTFIVSLNLTGNVEKCFVLSSERERCMADSAEMIYKNTHGLSIRFVVWLG